MATEHKRKIKNEMKNSIKDENIGLGRASQSDFYIENPQIAKTEELLKFLPLVMKTLGIDTEERKTPSTTKKKNNRKRKRLPIKKDVSKSIPANTTKNSIISGMT